MEPTDVPRSNNQIVRRKKTLNTNKGIIRPFPAKGENESKGSKTRKRVEGRKRGTKRKRSAK